MAGVLSFLLIDIRALIAVLPIPEQDPESLPPLAVLKLASVAQPAVLITLATLCGVFLASRVGLHAPIAEAIAKRGSIAQAARDQIFPGIAAGVVAGIAIILTWAAAKPFFSAEFVARAEAFNTLVPAAVRILYGGFTEEILLRWGVMTLLVWAMTRVFHGKDGEPQAFYFVAAIILSSVVFGVGHLPIASLLNGGLTVTLVIYVTFANALFGIIAGFLFWKRGLESAIIAHIFAHVVMLAAIYATG